MVGTFDGGAPVVEVPELPWCVIGAGAVRRVGGRQTQQLGYGEDRVLKVLHPPGVAREQFGVCSLDAVDLDVVEVSLVRSKSPIASEPSG